MENKYNLLKKRLLKGNANLYELSDGRFVIVSRANTFGRRDETMIFPANKDGEVVDWGDLYAGYGEDHETALNNYLNDTE